MTGYLILAGFLLCGCVASDFAVKSGRLRDRDALDALIFKIGLAQDRGR